MNKKILFFTIYLFYILPALAHSSSLLGESWNYQWEEYNFRDDISLVEMILGLAYYSGPEGGPFTIDSFIQGSDSYIGFDSFTNVENMVYDYNISNSPFYESFVQKLTDNEADLIYSGTMLPDFNEPHWIYGLFGDESDVTFFGSSMVGKNIDFFRLKINELIVERRDPDGYIGSGYGDPAMHIKADYTWQVWGSENVDPPPNPVPEPTTMLLFGTGIIGLVGSRFRRKKK